MISKTLVLDQTQPSFKISNIFTIWDLSTGTIQVSNTAGLLGFAAGGGTATSSY